MSNHEQALRILGAARRRLARRLAECVIASEVRILRASKAGHDPMAAGEDLDRLTAGLERINHAIAGLRATAGRSRAAETADESPRTVSNNNHVFAEFFGLVRGERLEEAARELSRLVQLPGDSAFTATRFFARTVKTNPAVISRVETLCGRIETTPEATCMDTLVAAFGLQAVESLNAVKALRNCRGPVAVAVPMNPTNPSTTRQTVQMAAAR